MTENELQDEAARIAKLATDPDAFFLELATQPLEVLEATRKLLERVTTNYAAQGRLDMVRRLVQERDYAQGLNATLHKSNEINESQVKRLKTELADTRDELAKVRHAYNQQHDVWEALYVKDGIARLKERAAAYDSTWKSLHELAEACDLTEEECNAMVGRVAPERRRIRLLETALRRIRGAWPDEVPERLPPEPAEMSFAERVEYFAKLSVQKPVGGAATSRAHIDINAYGRHSEALLHLLDGLCKLSAGASTFDDVRNLAHEAWLKLAGRE